VRPGFVLLLYFVAVVFGGALGAPWLYRAVRGAASMIPALQPLAAHPFSRYLSRALLLAALLTPAFLNLTLAGMVLGVCYQRTGSLLLPVGLHAGWILGLKLGGFMTRAVADTPGAFWGSSQIINGWLAFLALSLLLAFCLRFSWPGPRTDGAPWERNLQPG